MCICVGVCIYIIYIYTRQGHNTWRWCFIINLHTAKTLEFIMLPTKAVSLHVSWLYIFANLYGADNATIHAHLLHTQSFLSAEGLKMPSKSYSKPQQLSPIYTPSSCRLSAAWSKTSRWVVVVFLRSFGFVERVREWERDRVIMSLAIHLSRLVWWCISPWSFASLSGKEIIVANEPQRVICACGCKVLFFGISKRASRRSGVPFLLTLYSMWHKTVLQSAGFVVDSCQSLAETALLSPYTYIRPMRFWSPDDGHDEAADAVKY